MYIINSNKFKKKYKKLPVALQEKFKSQFRLFHENPKNPVLKDHPLKGSLLGCRAFSVTGDYRAVYKYIAKNAIKMINIGPHSQVYE